MKTFNKEDLITWYNRDQAEVGKSYYFASCLSDIQNRVNDGKCKFKLRSIDDNRVDQPFECDDRTCFCWACILPEDKVIEKQSEKKFRPLKNIKEMYELIFDIVRNSEIFGIGDKSEEQCIYELISDCILHLKNKQSGAEYYTAIRSICKNEDIQILINSSFSFEDLFDEFEIELNSKWVPFGIEETEE